MDSQKQPELVRHLRSVRNRLADGHYNLAPIFRTEGFFKENDESGPVRQALAFAEVLGRIPLSFNPGELIVGSTQGLFSPTLPPEYEQDDYRQAQEKVHGEINPSFWGHFDHACPDYVGLLREGPGGLITRTQERLKSESSTQKKEFLRGVLLSLSAFRRWILRWSRAVRKADNIFNEKQIQAHTRRLTRITERPPDTFHEALQLIWLADLALNLEGRGAMAFGRMDQYLYPFYRRDLRRGILNRSQALELLTHFFGKLEEPARPNPINNITVGGMTPCGEDATNELSYLLLEAADTVRGTRHNLTARWYAGTPESFKAACFRLIRTGIGFPAIVNDEVMVTGLSALGYSLPTVRSYCFVGCIETYFPGQTGPWADSRFNLLKVLSELIAEEAARPDPQPSYSAFEAKYMEKVKAGVSRHADAVRREERKYRSPQYAAPFLSALIADCIDRGLDVNDGGARHPGMHGIAGMGLATAADSLCALQGSVYREGRFTLKELHELLSDNFSGRERERQYLINRFPKYGNGDLQIDRIAARIVDTFGDAVIKERTAGGGRFLPLLAANVQNIAAGREVGATPDGRRAGVPVSDAASPHFGRDRNGPTAVIRSLSRIDYTNSLGGNVVNMKLSTGKNTEAETRSFIELVNTYFAMGGLQMQFNTTDRRTLLAARKNPEKYADLIVRVSGFSARFTGLADAVQEDIISRTEHSL